MEAPRYTPLPDLPPPWPGAGQPVWDTAMNTHALLRRPDADDQDYLTRARQRLAMHLPGLFRVVDAGEDGSGPYAVCEWLNGELMEAVVARGPLSLADYAHLSLQVLDTLASLHDSGWCARSLGLREVILLPSAHGGPPSFKLLSKIFPLGADADAAKRAGLYDFGKLSWHLLVGREFTASEPDIAGKLAQKRPDMPAGVARALADMLHADEEKRPASARDIRQTMEIALVPQLHAAAAAAWQPPPMMYTPPAMQPHAWQPPVETPPAPQPVEVPLPAPAPTPAATATPAPASNAPKPKPISAPGSQTQALSKKPVASAPAAAVPAEKKTESAKPKPFPWGPVIGGTITLILAFFLARIFVLPLWESWREDAARQEALEKDSRDFTPPKPPPAEPPPAENKSSPKKQNPDKKTSAAKKPPAALDAKDVAGVKKQMRRPVIITGTPLKASESKDSRNLYLWFGEQSSGDAVYLSLEKKTVEDATLQTLESMIGKKVTATGIASQYQGKPLVKVTKLADVKVE